MKLLNFETDEEVTIPTMRIVCPRCDGSGVHDHPAFSNGITQDQFDEDPDFREEYMSGRYDVACEECKGRNVVDTPDREKCTPEQIALIDEHAKADRRHYYEGKYFRDRGIEW